MYVCFCLFTWSTKFWLTSPFWLFQEDLEALAVIGCTVEICFMDRNFQDDLKNYLLLRSASHARKI